MNQMQREQLTEKKWSRRKALHLMLLGVGIIYLFGFAMVELMSRDRTVSFEGALEMYREAILQPFALKSQWYWFDLLGNYPVYKIIVLPLLLICCGLGVKYDEKHWKVYGVISVVAFFLNANLIFVALIGLNLYLAITEERGTAKA